MPGRGGQVGPGWCGSAAQVCGAFARQVAVRAAWRRAVVERTGASPGAAPPAVRGARALRPTPNGTPTVACSLWLRSPRGAKAKWPSKISESPPACWVWQLLWLLVEGRQNRQQVRGARGRGGIRKEGRGCSPSAPAPSQDLQASSPLISHFAFANYFLGLLPSSLTKVNVLLKKIFAPIHYFPQRCPNTGL